MAHVLIVDDDDAFTSGLAAFLRSQGHSASTANSVATARVALGDRLPTLLLLDLMLPDGSGLELLSEIKSSPPKRVVIVTGHPGVKSFVGDVAGPNIGYLTKPVEPREISAILNALSEEQDPPSGDSKLHFGVLVGESEPIQRVYASIRQVAGTDSTVLVQGESGTGKELIAEAIHRESGRAGDFVPVNCGALSKDLVSSELFGHEKGSFTGASRKHIGFFQRADGGTLFLDEITEMPLEMQTLLLRVLETGKVLPVGGQSEVSVDSRLVAATNRDPVKAVQKEALREDLYFRLRVFPIELPPLRQRREDIPFLAEHFLADLNAKYGTSKRFEAETIDRFQSHSWPGNVRELKHTVHRAYILAEGNEAGVKAPEHFDQPLHRGEADLPVGSSIAEVEKKLILSTLRHLDGDKKAAAATLGISLKTLYNRLSEYEGDESGA